MLENARSKTQKQNAFQCCRRVVYKLATVTSMVIFRSFSDVCYCLYDSRFFGTAVPNNKSISNFNFKPVRT